MSRVCVFVRVFLLIAFLATGAPHSFSKRLRLAPRFHAGQILFYRIDFNSSRNMKTAGPISSPQLPPSSALAATGDVAGAISHLQKAATDSDPAVREEAAQMLGIGERTLYRKIKEYEL